MKNTYAVTLWNEQCCFDSENGFTSLKAVQLWANGRHGKYDVHIYKNGSEEIYLSYTIKN